VLRLHLLVWVLCSNNINIHLTFSLGLVCYLANPLILLSRHPKLPYYLILCFLMLHAFIKLWVLFNISLLRDQIFDLLLTESVNLCTLQHIFIGMSLNTSCVILRVRQHMTSILLLVLPLPYMLYRCRLGNDRKSKGGYLVFFGQMSISWKSSKQRIVARSSTEAEYKALADGTAEVIWLQYLSTNLQISFVSAPSFGVITLVPLICL